jgi:hypothetical protein
MKKRIIVVTLLVLVAGVAAAGLGIFWDDGQFSASQCARLREGMTQDEVATILGSPPGDHTHGAGRYRLLSEEGEIVEILVVSENPERLKRCWCGQSSAIEVFFDDDGRLMYKWHYERWPAPTAWQRLARWLPFGK